MKQTKLNGPDTFHPKLLKECKTELYIPRKWSSKSLIKKADYQKSGKKPIYQ